MVVDGRLPLIVRNYWVSDDEMEMPQPGEEVGFALEKIEMHVDDIKKFEAEIERWTHVLPCWSAESTERAVFPLKRPARREALPLPRKHHVWQLVPRVKESCAGTEVFVGLGRVF